MKNYLKMKTKMSKNKAAQSKTHSVCAPKPRSFMNKQTSDVNSKVLQNFDEIHDINRKTIQGIAGGKINQFRIKNVKKQQLDNGRKSNHLSFTAQENFMKIKANFTNIKADCSKAKKCNFRVRTHTQDKNLNFKTIINKDKFGHFKLKQNLIQFLNLKNFFNILKVENIKTLFVLKKQIGAGMSSHVWLASKRCDFTFNVIKIYRSRFLDSKDAFSNLTVFANFSVKK